MSLRCLLQAVGLPLLTLVFAQAQSVSPSAAQGRLLFESRCVACHSLDSHRVGPALGTVWGRVAGKAPDFSYSKALRGASHVWTTERLQVWLANPGALVPGTTMPYRLELAADGADVAAYLALLVSRSGLP